MPEYDWGVGYGTRRHLYSMEERQKTVREARERRGSRLLGDFRIPALCSALTFVDECATDGPGAALAVPIRSGDDPSLFRSSITAHEYVMSLKPCTRCAHKARVLDVAV